MVFIHLLYTQKVLEKDSNLNWYQIYYVMVQTTFFEHLSMSTF